MTFKVVVIIALVGLVQAGLLVQPLQPVVAEPHNPNPQYSFLYEVQDPTTGDSHGQFESRNGDVVQGAYALMDSDGTRRLVEYTADPVHGFNAVVSKQPTGRAVDPSTKIVNVNTGIFFMNTQANLLKTSYSRE
ncbi:larval cuticle protein A2B [Leptinotarsa decemlineata]|uniref:larval cuticle protein A2B n=1 Tax=Leptinotarsa decemlineata TaxID=7539 RepID=UPI003D30888A